MKARFTKEEAKARLAEAKKRWYLKNRETLRATHLERLRTDPEYRDRLNGHRKRWNERNPEKAKAHSRAWNWKIQGCPEPTRPEPTACECCGKTDWKALALDHCHETGRFRGWLCSNCNLAIGRMGDTLEGVQRALDYLKRSVS